MFSLSTNVAYPILSAIDPQLVVVHMKELGDITAVNLSNRLFDLEAMWENCVPNGDIVYIGTPWEEQDLTSDRTKAQNKIFREAAIRDNRCYVDCMTPMVSYQWMNDHGYFFEPDDKVQKHLNKKGSQVLADILWEKLGCYALRLDKQLHLNRTSDEVVLDWASREGVAFELQSTTNLTSWDSRYSVSGDGTQLGWTNLAPRPQEYYRLQLSPD